VSTQYTVTATGGTRVTVYEQNVERTSRGSLHRAGAAVHLSWSPDHTFVIGEPDPATPVTN
jgi:hypothetical protein